MNFHEALALYYSANERKEKIDFGLKRIEPYVVVFASEQHIILRDGLAFSPRWRIEIPSEDLIKRFLEIGTILNDEYIPFTGISVSAFTNTHRFAKITGLKPQTEFNEYPELITPLLNSALNIAINISGEDLEPL